MPPICPEPVPDFHPDLRPCPAGPGGSISVVGGEDIVMTNSCPSKTDAEEFVRFLLSDEAQKDMAEVGQMPVLSGLGSQLTDIKPYYGVFAKQLRDGSPAAAAPAVPEDRGDPEHRGAEGVHGRHQRAGRPRQRRPADRRPPAGLLIR